MSLRLPRRDFLKHASLWTAALGGGACGASVLSEQFAVAEDAVKKPALPVVDTHLHLWDLEEFKLPWTKGKGLETLDRSFLMSDFLTATRGLNVTKAVYMEVDVHPSQQVKEAEYVAEICKRGDTPMVAAVISGRPASPEFKDYITRFAENKHIKGVRQVLHGDSTPPGYCLQPRFVKGIQLLGELGKSFDLCLRPGEIADAVKLVEQCPNTKFILDHCGNMSVQSRDEELLAKWKTGIEELAKHENVVCKISGIVAAAEPRTWTAKDLAPVINFTVETFGKDRIMFGGDWPVCTLTASYRQWFDALQEIVRSWTAEEKRKLFHDNAVRVYGLVS